MPKYQIRVHSCRKDTIVHMRLNSWQANVLQRLAKLTQHKSQSECEPTLHVSKVTVIRPIYVDTSSTAEMGKG